LPQMCLILKIQDRKSQLRVVFWPSFALFVEIFRVASVRFHAIPGVTEKSSEGSATCDSDTETTGSRNVSNTVQGSVLMPFHRESANEVDRASAHAAGSALAGSDSLRAIRFRRIWLVDTMRLGCCGSMIAPTDDPIGIRVAGAMAEIGFDYIELSLSDIVALPEPSFAALAQRLVESGIACEACNNFFPARIRLTGPEARIELAIEYARQALDRAARLGARVIVFGSSGAKNVPAGFPKQDAWRQIVALLRQLGPLAASHSTTIAIEPINKLESNIVNLAAEGLRLVREVEHPNIQLLIDYYHLMMEQEDPAIIHEAGPAIRHLHFAQMEGRLFPREREAAYARFFDSLIAAGYSGRCSIEAFTQDFAADARRALGVLREVTRNRD